ncbi:MAG: apolipoprotein N-acyltransferase [Bacteroidales bacterium]|nr:apolipoprotein N-acyltransferase [Bacteroidales bacterium]
MKRFVPSQFTLTRWIWFFSSIVLLSLPFLHPHCGCLALLAWVPFLILERDWYERGKKHRIWLCFLFFAVWNLLTIMWLRYATWVGALGALVGNTAQMGFVFLLFRAFRQHLDRQRAERSFKLLPYIFLVALWIAWEYFYTDSELSFPWLMLGNSFANTVKWIQWYEYTGTIGGTLWIWMVNLALFRVLVLYRAVSIFPDDRPAPRLRPAWLAGLVLLVIVPITASIIRYANYQEVENPREFVVLQPNIEPHVGKFKGYSRERQDQILLDLATAAVTDTTTFLVAPETFTWTIDEEQVLNFTTVRKFSDFLQQHPASNFIFGAITIHYYPWNTYPGSSENSRPTLTARKAQGYWYDTFNASLILDAAGKHDIFHKSKLVPFAEFLPFPEFISRFGSLAISLGGTVNSYGKQPEISVFTANDGTRIGTAICYESVYGDYCRGYVEKGAQVLTIITNDGWWRDTPGYRQHLSYARLRAIELRRSIARSANTGISALINQRGDIIARTNWWKESSLRGSLNLSEDVTFYVRHGDVIARIAQFLAALLSLYWLSFAWSSRLAREQRSNR